MKEEEFPNFGKIYALVNKRFNAEDKAVNQQCYLTYEIIKEELKKNGCISKTAVEQAKEIRSKWDDYEIKLQELPEQFTEFMSLTIQLISYDYEAIQELEAKIEELKEYYKPDSDSDIAP